MARKAAKRSVAKTRLKTTSKKQSSASNSQLAAAPSAELLQASTVIPSIFGLTRQSGSIIWQYKKLFASIVGLYVVLHILLVQGLSGVTDVASLRDQFANRLNGSFAAYFQLISGSGGTNQAGQGYQTALLVIFSLALIWALRQLREQATIRVRDTFYKGMYPLVPLLLVVLIMGIQLLPMLIGLNIYELVLTSGIAANGLERAIWGIGALALTLLTLYLLVASIMALYIVTLPNMTPREALRSAGTLVRNRRWTVLRKMLFLPLVLLLMSGVILLPVIVFVPQLAPWLLTLLGAITLTYSHSYMYALYRGLLHE